MRHQRWRLLPALLCPALLCGHPRVPHRTLALHLSFAAQSLICAVCHAVCAAMHVWLCCVPDICQLPCAACALLQAEADEETDSEQEADEELGEGEQGRTRRRRAAGRTGSTPAQLDFPPHELPEDFRQGTACWGACRPSCHACFSSWGVVARRPSGLWSLWPNCTLTAHGACACACPAFAALQLARPAGRGPLQRVLCQAHAGAGRRAPLPGAAAGGAPLEARRAGHRSLLLSHTGPRVMPSCPALGPWPGAAGERRLGAPSSDSPRLQPLLPLACAPAVQYPADELPSYPKSSTHLKGRDAWLQERVTRELSTAYSQVPPPPLRPISQRCPAVLPALAGPASGAGGLAVLELLGGSAAGCRIPAGPAHAPLPPCPQLFMDLQWTVKAFQTYWLARWGGACGAGGRGCTSPGRSGTSHAAPAASRAPPSGCCDGAWPPTSVGALAHMRSCMGLVQPDMSGPQACPTPQAAPEVEPSGRQPAGGVQPGARGGGPGCPAGSGGAVSGALRHQPARAAGDGGARGNRNGGEPCGTCSGRR